MLDSVTVEDAEGHSRVRVDLLRILIFMSLFLNSFKLAEQEDGSVFDVRFSAIFFWGKIFLTDDVSEYGMVDGEPIYAI